MESSLAIEVLHMLLNPPLELEDVLLTLVYRRLLAAWAENNYLQERLNFLEILDSICPKKIKLYYGSAQNYMNSSGM